LYLVDDYRSARTARNRVEVAAGTRTAAR
jgi:hypothetical protein